ncbi:MAG TPA: hypothetical protein VFD91_14450 [Mariniphaga sp.]|nr:hypothetical protein [Mariniphaga sp.]
MLCLILAAAALSVVYVRMLGIVAFANSITLCSIIHNSPFIIQKQVSTRPQYCD